MLYILTIFLVLVLNFYFIFFINIKYNNILKGYRDTYIDLIKSVVKNEVYTNKLSLTMVANDRLENVKYLIENIIINHIKGDIVECGTWRGGVMAFARSILNIYNDKNRIVRLFDTFKGFPCLPNSQYIYEREWCKDKIMNDNSLENVKESFFKLNLLKGVLFYKGLFNETIKDDLINEIAILRLDADSYDNTLFLLNKLYCKVKINGFIIIDDYSDWKSCKKAVNFFRDTNKIYEKIIVIKSGSAYWKKENLYL